MTYVYSLCCTQNSKVRVTKDQKYNFGWNRSLLRFSHNASTQDVIEPKVEMYIRFRHRIPKFGSGVGYVSGDMRNFQIMWRDWPSSPSLGIRLWRMVAFANDCLIFAVYSNHMHITITTEPQNGDPDEISEIVMKSKKKLTKLKLPVWLFIGNP